MNRKHEEMIMEWIERTEKRLDSLERLSPTGSGAMTCCGGRGAGDQQGSVEEEGAQRLNREDWRVAPGEAEAAILRAIEWNKNAAAHHRLEASCAVAENLFAHARFHKSRELQHSDDSVMLENLLPKPDSEAPEERSGRRNSELSQPDPQ